MVVPKQLQNITAVGRVKEFFEGVIPLPNNFIGLPGALTAPKKKAGLRATRCDTARPYDKRIQK